MVNGCKHTKKGKSCIRRKDKKTFKLPRRFSRKRRRKSRGFTMRSSCAPYKGRYQKGGEKKTKKIKKTQKTQTSFFAGGCFWGIEKKFSELKGVLETQVGYMGGNYKDPTYEDVCSGVTGHLETVKVTYNPMIISYKRLVDFLMKICDKKNYEPKSQYHSAIFCTGNQRKQLKTQTAKLLPMVKLLPITEFYVAEDYHQKYNFQKPCTKLDTESFDIFQKICKNNSRNAEKIEGKYLFTYDKGIYSCACCGTNLYDSEDKYDSGSGWPAFSASLSDERLLFNTKSKEVRCSKCGLHLGHRTFDGPTKTKIHDCINSVCLSFEPSIKKLTQKGKAWVEAASLDMIQRTK